MVLEVLLPCEPLGDRFLFFFLNSGKKTRVVALGICTFWMSWCYWDFFFQTFYSVFLSGFIRNNWKFHMFFLNVILPQMSERTPLVCRCFWKLVTMLGHLEDAN